MVLSIIPQLILILVLTGLNAYFAASEMALVSVDKLVIQEMVDKGNKKAKALLEIINNPNKFLATIQVGITLAGFFSSASAATGLAGGLESYLEGLSVPFAGQISVVAITILLSYFILVFGELLPKRLALGNALKIALFTVSPLNIISKITAPFVKVLTLSISGLMKLFRISQEDMEDKVSEEKIRFLIKKGTLDGSIKPIEEQRIRRIFEFDDRLVKNVMVPKKEVLMINIDNSVENILVKLVENKHSRVPVYEKEIHNIIGIILLKDVFELSQKEPMTVEKLRELLYSPIIVTQNSTVDKVFLLLQKSKKHMAVVKNSQGKFVGIITIEDMIEEIFGNIEDEFDG
jgi:putative hemolysin